MGDPVARASRVCVRASSSSWPRGVLRWAERCCPSALQARRSEMLIVCTMCSTQARRRAGLRVSPGGLLQDQFLQREIRDGLPEALVLGLQRLHALDLIGLEPAVLLPPAIVRHLGHPDVRIASATGVPWATSTSTWRSLATISSGLCLFLDMDPSSFGSKAILQGGPLQRGRINTRSDQPCR